MVDRGRVAKETRPGARGNPPRRHKRRSVRRRIVALVLIPLVSLVALWGFAAYATLGAANANFSVSTTYDKVAVPGTALATQLQLERNLSAAYLAERSQGRLGTRSRVRLETQRGRTDEALTAFRRSALSKEIRDIADARIRQRLTDVTERLDTLPTLRTTVDSGRMPPLDAINDYGAVIGAGIHLFNSLVLVNDVGIYRQGRGLISISWAREYMLREDALIGAVLARDRQVASAERVALVQWAANRRISMESGLIDLEGGLRETVQAHVELPGYQRFYLLESGLMELSGTRLPEPVVQDWAKTVPALGTALGQASTQAGRLLTEEAEPIARRILAQLIIAGGVGLLAVLTSVVVSALFGRSLTRELRRLRGAARELAEERLPSVVRRLRGGADVDLASEARPVPAGRIREIAEVAEAFGQVQRTAVESAIGEAQLRKGISRVFLNLAWRSQSLLHRQLRMLDDMERRTADPEVLADLFRLDHLTTRMRRHSEGLIILSGAAPGRSWSRPVSLQDVLRAAVAEVEDYQRVEVVVSTPAKLTGLAVADIIHLLAELIENATAFSPPGSEVLVRGELVGNGFAIEVVDRGLGIHPHERAELNARLAQPPEFDLADSDRLGLFVVARLAARHGVRVALQESVFAGTSAVVILPHELIEESAVLEPGDQEPVEGSAIEVPPPPNRAWFEPRRLRQMDLGPGPAVAAVPAVPAGPAEPPAPPASSGRPPLPRRMRQANMAPQLRASASAGGGTPQAVPDKPTERSPEETRRLMESLQFGWERGRADEETGLFEGPNGERP
jgi:signal transduction histidine kinase